VTFVDALGILGRRWYLVLLGLVLTAVLALSAAYRLEDGHLVSKFAPEYESSAVVNVAAADQPDPSGSAPSEAPRVAYSLKAIVESPSFGRRIAGEVPAWGGGSIKASVPSQTSLVELLVAGRTRSSAADAMTQVLAALPESVASLVAPSAASSLHVDVTGTPTPPAEQPSTKGPLALALVGLLGLAATWAAAVGTDRIRAARWSARPAHVDLRDTDDDDEDARPRRVPGRTLAGGGAG